MMLLYIVIDLAVGFSCCGVALFRLFIQNGRN